MGYSFWAILPGLLLLPRLTLFHLLLLYKFVANLLVSLSYGIELGVFRLSYVVMLLLCYMVCLGQSVLVYWIDSVLLGAVLWTSCLLCCVWF